MAKRDNKGFEINKGDTVTITAHGVTLTGTVLSADWWGEEDGWYIEMENARTPLGRTVPYSYWKQGQDGGTVTKWR